MAMFIVEENAPSPKEFLSLRKSAGMGARSLEGAKKGLGNELYAVKLLEYSTKKIVAHDEKNECNIGDKVKVMETRPMSKQKNWRLINVMEKVK